MKSREEISVEYQFGKGVRIEVIGKGGCKQWKPYLRFETLSGEYLGSIEHKGTLKKLKRIIEEMIE